MSGATREPYRLSVLGSRLLLSPDGDRVSSVLAQPKRLCLLTYLALAPDPVSRSTLHALFWPESDDQRARNALNQAVFYLRRSTSTRVVESSDGGLVWVPSDRLWCDAREVLEGRATDETLVRAAERDLLEGWIADDSQALQEWLDATRRRIREHAQKLLAEAGVLEPEVVTPPPLGPAPDEARPRPDESGEDPESVSGAPRRGPETEGRDESKPRPVGSTGGRRAWVALAAVLATVAVVAVSSRPGAGDGLDAAVVELPADASAPAAAPETRPSPTLLLLRPIWTPASDAPEGLEGAIMAHVLASLHALDSLRVQDASFLTERADIRRVLDAIGQEERPELFLQIVLTLSGNDIRAQTNIWGELGVTLGSHRSDLAFQDLDRLVWDAPDSIAAVVLATVERGLRSRRASR